MDIIRKSTIFVVLLVLSCTVKPCVLLEKESTVENAVLATTVLGNTPLPLSAKETKTPSLEVRTERWVEYERALAGKFLPGTEGMCEWEILGEQGDKIYVWAVCQVKFSLNGAATSAPAVIYLKEDGEIKDVKMPRDGTQYASDIRDLFPSELHGKVLSNTVDTNTMWLHIQKRHRNPEPPLIVLAGSELP